MPTTANEGHGVGLNHIKWAEWKRNLLITGTYDPNDWDKLHTQQKWWTKETLNTLKALSVRDDVKLN